MGPRGERPVPTIVQVERALVVAGAVLFALLPAGAMALSLSLQSNLSVELGLSDREIATLSLWSTILSEAF